MIKGTGSLTYRTIFEITIFGHETWPLAKVPHILSLYSRESKLSLFWLYGQRFPRYRPIFKIAIFRHETWPLTKDPEIAHSLSTTRGQIELIFALLAVVSEKQANFQNGHI